MAESPSHDEKNITLAGRTARDNAKTRERLSDLRVLGVSIAEPTLLSGIAVLSLAFGLAYVEYVSTRRLFPRRKTLRIDTHHAWVQDQVARLHPDGFKGYATAQDTVSWSGKLRKRVFMRKITCIEEQHEESAIYRSFRERPKPSTDTASLLEKRDKTGQHDGKQDNEGLDHESAWLPTASSSENEERLFPLASKYLRMVELILAELGVLGYNYFAFDHVDEHASLEPFWTTARQDKYSCEFSHWSASSALVQEISTSDFISPQRLFEDLGAATASDSKWLVEIPDLNFDSVRICTVDVDRVKRGALKRKKATWKYWQSGKLGTADFGFRGAPCLLLMGSCDDRSARLIFENVTTLDYCFILDRLGMDHSQRPSGAYFRTHLTRHGFMELHTRVMKKVMLAASEGSLDVHVRPQAQREGGLVFAGRYIEGEDQLDQIGENGKLLPMEQEDANDSTSSDTSSIHVETPPSSPPVQIRVERGAQTQDSLVTEHTFEPASGASPTTSRRRVRQTIAAWARVRFRRKARNEAGPSAAIPT